MKRFWITILYEYNHENRDENSIDTNVFFSEDDTREYIKTYTSPKTGALLTDEQVENVLKGGYANYSYEHFMGRDDCQIHAECHQVNDDRGEVCVLSKYGFDGSKDITSKVMLSMEDAKVMFVQLTGEQVAEFEPMLYWNEGDEKCVRVDWFEV